MDELLDKPIFRWAGGKNWLLRDLHKFLPSSFNNYHEPFFGGGSVFFYLKPTGKSYLSDKNDDLMNAYCVIRDNVEEVITTLKQFNNTEEEYYRIRDQEFQSALEQTAKFIYLNRFGFNGLYRVNLNGMYNVPYGFKKYKQPFDYGRLRRASLLLKNSILSSEDFEVSLKRIEAGDLVFLDPPYTASNVKNGFIKYNEKLFAWHDQERLALYIRRLIEKGAFYILTNAKHESVKELFGSLCSPIPTKRSNVIGGRNAKRGITEEYIFTNSI